ncbi:hypothetical protein MJA45_16260 [Paenibacillus aurantius]|uniref:Preprotein translocase subunit Tim44 n=1 Tax=Paenibacillus aurantius TaxID=2918900 RepID=A0AA96LCF1_9BACL|nr:hypothetical protein [Paenibacillus aurantius]WNQ09197.1 hypothetical protein MJA45_16260 [Paenibacillus aurantius]
MKKLLIVFMSCMVFFAMAAPVSVDAAKGRSGGYSSSKKSYTPTAPSNGVNKSQTGTTSKSDSTSTSSSTAAKKPGLFGGGSFLKGLALGGLAGLMFGGLFGNMGFLGNILGFMLNMFALVALFVLIKSVISYFVNRRKVNHKRY